MMSLHLHAEYHMPLVQIHYDFDVLHVQCLHDYGMMMHLPHDGIAPHHAQFLEDFDMNYPNYPHDGIVPHHAQIHVFLYVCDFFLLLLFAFLQVIIGLHLHAEYHMLLGLNHNDYLVLHLCFDYQDYPQMVCMDYLNLLLNENIDFHMTVRVRFAFLALLQLDFFLLCVLLNLDLAFLQLLLFRTRV